nr:uncharacterized protein LOC127305207 [Lolium perenne]
MAWPSSLLRKSSSCERNTACLLSNTCSLFHSMADRWQSSEIIWIVVIQAMVSGRTYVEKWQDHDCRKNGEIGQAICYVLNSVFEYLPNGSLYEHLQDGKDVSYLGPVGWRSCAF